MAKLTPLKAIRQQCIECCLGDLITVEKCPVTDCPLYEYRFGHRPKKDEEIPTEEDSEEKS